MLFSSYIVGNVDPFTYETWFEKVCVRRKGLKKMAQCRKGALHVVLS